MYKLPQARNEKLIIQELGKEILIYDLESDQAYSLNPTAAFIWNHCDGKTSFAEIIEQAMQESQIDLNADLINLALADFKKSKLLTEESSESLLRKPISRRRALIKYGLSAVAMPSIVMLVAPMATHAQSCQAEGEPCVTSADCCATLVCSISVCIVE